MKSILIALSLLTGAVMDSETNEPITGAKIEVLGEEKITYTDFDGIYNMVELSDTTQIKVSFISYQDTIVTYGQLKQTGGDIKLTSY